MAKAGDNSVAADDLRRLIERVESLEETKGEIVADIKDVYEEGKQLGYDTKVMRRVIAIRKLKKGEYDEQQLLIETYLSALGLI